MLYQCIMFIVTAYLLGSIPFGKLIAKQVARINITQRGSGNIGATNVARELGISWGLVTLLFDMLKGFLPVFLYAHYILQPGIEFETCLSAIGLAALLGHQFSIFMRFRGGKGVATAIGIYLAISPLACLMAVIVFILTVYKWDFVSLGSMLAAIVMPVLLACFGTSQPLVTGSIIVTALICFKHKGNIKRLFKGKERKWSGERNQPNRSSSRSSSSSE
jgi:acyl phosphate:glycerol-3-phosphate acyltransferase